MHFAEVDELERVSSARETRRHRGVVGLEPNSPLRAAVATHLVVVLGHEGTVTLRERTALAHATMPPRAGGRHRYGSDNASHHNGAASYAARVSRAVRPAMNATPTVKRFMHTRLCVCGSFLCACGSFLCITARPERRRA